MPTQESGLASGNDKDSEYLKIVQHKDQQIRKQNLKNKSGLDLNRTIEQYNKDMLELHLSKKKHAIDRNMLYASQEAVHNARQVQLEKTKSTISPQEPATNL